MKEEKEWKEEHREHNRGMRALHGNGGVGDLVDFFEQILPHARKPEDGVPVYRMDSPKVRPQSDPLHNAGRKYGRSFRSDVSGDGPGGGKKKNLKSGQVVFLAAKIHPDKDERVATVGIVGMPKMGSKVGVAVPECAATGVDGAGPVRFVPGVGGVETPVILLQVPMRQVFLAPPDSWGED